MTNEHSTPAQCVYHEECKGEGKHQCPRCKHWYCDECYDDLFLPLDPALPSKTAMICVNCHYGAYGGSSEQ